MGNGLFFLMCLPVILLINFINNDFFSGEKTADNNPANHYSTLSVEPKCTDCHAAIVEKKILHAPLKESCRSCHLVNIPDHPEKLPKGLFLTKKIPDLCYACHDKLKKEIDTLRVVHLAVSDGKQCMNCHSPHSSDENKLLVATKKEICLNCHDKELSILGRKYTNIKQLLSKSKVIHSAIEGGCSVCHKAHGSEYNYLLISAYPKGIYAPAKKDTFAFCFECHDSDLLELSKTTTATGFRQGKQNLHFVHLTGEKGRSCSVCHNAHASNNKFLIVDKVAYGKWEFRVNFAPTDSGGSCLPGCHGLTKYNRY
ncbi:MAG: cytochrome c3 family protein [Bacteroidota bacterium]